MKPKDEWIQKTMKSLDQLSKVEANPYLYEKIMARMKDRERSELTLTRKMIWKFSLGFAILLILNLAAIKKYNAQRSGGLTDASTSSNEYTFEFNYTY